MKVLYAAWVVVSFCSLVFAAPLLTSPSLSLLSGIDVNLTAPSSLKQPFSSNRLPADPFFYQAPDADEIVRFYDYGTPLRRADVIHVLLKATREVVAHGSSDEIIPDKILRKGWGDVYLILHQSGRMTWKLWETALQGIAEFMEKYEYVDFEFDIGQTGWEQFFGTGVIGMMKKDE